MTVPRSIGTERLTLRPFGPDDWRAMHEHYSDIECTRFTFGRALTEGESWRAVASMVGHWQLRGDGPYAVPSIDPRFRRWVRRVADGDGVSLGRSPSLQGTGTLLIPGGKGDPELRAEKGRNRPPSRNGDG